MTMKKTLFMAFSLLAATPILTIAAPQTADVTVNLSSPMQPCTIHLDPQWQPGGGIDPADNFNTHFDKGKVSSYPNGTTGFPDPGAFFTNSDYPGVTLPGPDRMKNCKWTVGKNFTWNAQQEQCLLNGPYWSHPTADNLQCTSGAKFNSQLMPWINAVVTATDKPRMIMMTLNIPGEGTKTVPVALGFGHGVLGTTCGGVSLVEYNGKYAAIMQTGMRAWSFEISSPTNSYLDANNTSGAHSCMIPKVYQLSDEDVQAILSTLENQKASH